MVKEKVLLLLLLTFGILVYQPHSPVEFNYSNIFGLINCDIDLISQKLQTIGDFTDSKREKGIYHVKLNRIQ